MTGLGSDENICWNEAKLQQRCLVISICKLWSGENFACYIPPEISGYILNPLYLRLVTNENITDVIFSAYFLSVPFWLFSTTLNIVLEVTWPITAKALVALFISVTQAGVLGRSNSVPGRKKKWFEWISIEVDNSLVHMCEKFFRISTVPIQSWPLLIMWWWSRFLLVAVQAPGGPADVTRMISDDRVIYSARKGLTLRWASREILRCAANLLKKKQILEMIWTSGCADQHPKHYGLVITCGKAFRPGGIRPHWKYLKLATLKTSSPPPLPSSSKLLAWLSCSSSTSLLFQTCEHLSV